jgi:hypothetical protein
VSFLAASTFLALGDMNMSAAEVSAVRGGGGGAVDVSVLAAAAAADEVSEFLLGLFRVSFAAAVAECVRVFLLPLAGGGGA